MQKIELICRGNGEALGKFYLKDAVTYALQGSFGKAYVFLREGLDLVTCDCTRGGWLQEYSKSNKKLFNDIEINHKPYYEYFLIKAFINSYETDKKQLYIALDAIDKYLEVNEDEYGFYIKGKVLLGLKESNEALTNFQLAYEMNPSPKLKYKIGRIKEEILGEYGLDNLYSAFISNPSSACCGRVLKKYSKIRNVVFTIDKNEKNELLLAFDDSNDEWQFQKKYESMFIESLSLFNENQISIIRGFVSFLINSSTIFVPDKRDSSYERFIAYDDDDGYDWTREITNRDAFDTDEQYNDWLES